MRVQQREDAVGYRRLVPQYRNDASEADYLRLKAAMLELARSGQFDTNDALVYATSRGLTMNAGDVAAIVGSSGESASPRSYALSASRAPRSSSALDGSSSTGAAASAPSMGSARRRSTITSAVAASSSERSSTRFCRRSFAVMPQTVAALTRWWEILQPTLGSSRGGTRRRTCAVRRRSSPRDVPSRNEPCPCGSGRKYKRYCLERLGTVARELRERDAVLSDVIEWIKDEHQQELEDASSETTLVRLLRGPTGRSM